jgi:hypothetical protein
MPDVTLTQQDIDTICDGLVSLSHLTRRNYWRNSGKTSDSRWRRERNLADHKEAERVLDLFRERGLCPELWMDPTQTKLEEF